MAVQNPMPTIERQDSTRPRHPSRSHDLPIGAVFTRCVGWLVKRAQEGGVRRVWCRGWFSIAGLYHLASVPPWGRPGSGGSRRPRFVTPYTGIAHTIHGHINGALQSPHVRLAASASRCAGVDNFHIETRFVGLERYDTSTSRTVCTSSTY